MSFIALTTQNPKGTRMFQSANVLSSAYHPDVAHTHDYLDDLESFYYVTAYLILAYDARGRFLRHPREMKDWDDCSASGSFQAKITYMTTKGSRVASRASSTWGKECCTLLEQFHDLIRDVTLARHGEEVIPNERDSDYYYDAIKVIFETAIAQLPDEEPMLDATLPIAPRPPTTPKKRPSEDDEESAPKRPRTRSETAPGSRATLRSISEER